MKQSYQLRALILDMDGVLWRADQPLGHLSSIFDRITSLELQVALATNNATLSVEQYLEKLRLFSVELEPWQIVNSPQATAHYLQKQFPNGGSVYVVGESGLIQTLAEYNFYPSEEQVCAVVVGLDRFLTYEKLRLANRFIRSGALFIGTNPDRTYPTPDGQVPGAGAILAALEAASDLKPAIMGKPSPEMYWLALERLGVSPQEALVVGDRLETDIAGAQAIGCPTALVLSGVSTPHQAAGWRPAPDWITADLTTLLDELERIRT